MATFIEAVSTSYNRMQTKPFFNLILPNNEKLTLNYHEFIQEAFSWTLILQKEALPKQAHVIILLDHSLSLFTAFIGAILGNYIPAIYAPPSPKITEEDYRKIIVNLLAHTNAKAIVTNNIIKKKYLDELPLSGVTVIDSTIARQGLLANNINLSLDESGIAFIQYSSGTTGMKKGVEISFNALMQQINSYSAAITFNHDDHIVSWLPIYHDMGLITGLLLPFIKGIPITCFSPFDWVTNPTKLLTLISENRGTLCWLPNFAFNFIAKVAEIQKLTHLDLSCLRAVINCAESISYQAMMNFFNTLSPLKLNEKALATCYAMAENTFAVTSSHTQNSIVFDDIDDAILRHEKKLVPGSKRVLSSGRALTDTHIIIADEKYLALADKQLGEILIKSPCMLSGYYNNPTKTKESFVNGYYKTGDLGYLLDGELFVVGRIDDVIIIAGINIFPEDVEAIANTFQDVISGRSVAFGDYDETSGTEKLIILAESNEAKTDAEIIRLEKTLANAIHRALDSLIPEVYIVPPKWLKKSTSGKIARGSNKARYQAELKINSLAVFLENSLLADGDPITHEIYKAVKMVTKITHLTLDECFISKGLIDSLDLVTLITDLSKNLKIDLPSPAEIGIDRYDSIARIRNLVDEIKSGKLKKLSLAKRSMRQSKCDVYLNSDKEFDLLILGSSRSFAINTCDVDKFNYKSFNFSINAARAEDWWCILNFALHHNIYPLKRILLNIDLQAFVGNAGIQSTMLDENRLNIYLENSQFNLSAGILPASHASDRINYEKIKLLYALREAGWGHDLGTVEAKTGNFVAVYPTNNILPPEEHDRENASQRMFVRDFSSCHPGRLSYLKAFIQLCLQKEIFIDFFIPPFHANLYQFLAENTDYVSHLNKLKAFIANDYASHTSLYHLHDFSETKYFSRHQNNFTDASHMGCLLAKEVVDKIFLT